MKSCKINIEVSKSIFGHFYIFIEGGGINFCNANIILRSNYLCLNLYFKIQNKAI